MNEDYVVLIYSGTLFTSKHEWNYATYNNILKLMIILGEAN